MQRIKIHVFEGVKEEKPSKYFYKKRHSKNDETKD